ncbi:hypothetical protein HMPREF9970_2093 [Lachnoanaerobaculum saburreum F0468]|uniref:Uncharacterized protein n=1 Tax=Lachnoanaerobaculum saburreum F0468 TaxID=1095750 RepID=I0R868_9FIRM|nr:hypothetical protein HMPREF9970_2093 [Lachnoanaerobaculum saburreum F0468]
MFLYNTTVYKEIRPYKSFAYKALQAFSDTERQRADHISCKKTVRITGMNSIDNSLLF